MNEFKNLINFDNFVFIVQNKCSDIFIAVIIYLYEARPFNNDVINIFPIQIMIICLIIKIVLILKKLKIYLKQNIIIIVLVQI